MKRVMLSVLSFSLVILSIIAMLFGMATHYYISAGPLKEDKIVLIERGKSVSEIADILQQEHVISQGLLFKVLARFGDSLKAGEYAFHPQISLGNVLVMMREGKVYDRKVTIPEGLTSYQIVKLLNAREDLAGDISTVPAEGSLLPDTYHFVLGESREEKINQMQEAMTKALDELWPKRAEGLPFKTKEEALILASIVEKETGLRTERTRVAGVFVNRLKQGMALQTDPTVIYALTKGKIQDEGKGPLGRRLLSKDLETDSPYNTYKNAGLPPGPICNPGYAAIEAVLHPEDHGYLYFVANGSGGHVFAKTLAEHNSNVEEWRKVRRSQ